MDNKERFYPESRFGGFTDMDGTIAFFNRVNSLLTPSSIVLDVGCGRGAYGEDPVSLRRNLRILRGKVDRVIGIDIDPNAQDNPFIDEFVLMRNNSWPIDSDSIDLILCDNVLEHIPAPGQFFLEVRRVLRTDGFLCIRTPNRWSYVALAAMLIPNRYHARVTSVVQEIRNEQDVFPTVYKCNTLRILKAMLRRNGFECSVYGHESEPSYLSFSRFAYFLGVVHQRLAPGFLKPVIFAFGRKKKGFAAGTP